MQRTLILVAAFASLAVLVFVLSESLGDVEHDSAVARDAESAPQTAAKAELASTPASSGARQPSSAPVVAEPVAPIPHPVRAVEAAPTKAVFTVQISDEDGVPVPGITASVQINRTERRANAISIFAPSRPAGGSLGFGDAALDRDLGQRTVVHATKGATLISGRDGEIVTEFNDPAFPSHELSAVFRFGVPETSLFAPPSPVTVPAGETRRIVVERSGSIELHLAPLAGGVIPHVRASGAAVLAEAGVSAFHADVMLVLRGGTRARQGKSHALGRDAVLWEGLGPGPYDILARAMGSGRTAVLNDVRVAAGRACDDPRLAAWNPFEDMKLMLVTVEGTDGSPPPTLTVGLSRPSGHRPWFGEKQTARYDGRTLPIVVDGNEDRQVYFQAPGSRRVTIEIAEGARHVTLGAGITLELTFVVSPEMAADPKPIQMTLVEGNANTEWTFVSRDDPFNGVLELRRAVVSSGVLAPERRHISWSIAKPGRYTLRAPAPPVREVRDGVLNPEVPWQDFVPVTIDVEDEPIVRKQIELQRAR